MNDNTEAAVVAESSARFPAADRDGLAQLLEPYLRRDREEPDEDDMPAGALLAFADSTILLDALHAAGVLVFTDTDDRAHLRKSWAAMLGAQEQLQRILSHGATPKPSELGAILATLGGRNPYDEGDPGDPGDPWRDCWLSDEAAGVIAEDQTAGDQGDQGDQGDAPAPVLPVVDNAELAEQVTERAQLLLAFRAATLLAEVPADARAYALPWPAGTRALYDPINGVTFDDGGDNAAVISRALFVPFDSGENADRFPVGTVRRLATHEKRRGHLRHWWECRFCKMGATGAASAEAEWAECLGHEAICPDQDKITAVVPAGEDRFA